MARVNIIEIKIVVLGWNLGFLLVCVFDLVSRDMFHWTSRPLVSLSWFWEEWNTSMTKFQRSKAGNPSCVNLHREKLFQLCRTVWNWSLFLAHPTYWHKRVTSENAQNSPWCWFWVFQISGKIGILNQICSALLCCVSYTTTQPVFTCVVNVRDQTRQPFVTGFCPLRDRMSKFVFGQLKVRSSQYVPNIDSSRQFESRMWTILQLNNFFFLELVVVNAWCCDFVELLSCFVCSSQYLSTFAWPSMS